MKIIYVEWFFLKIHVLMINRYIYVVHITSIHYYAEFTKTDIHQVLV